MISWKWKNDVLDGESIDIVINIVIVNIINIVIVGESMYIVIHIVIVKIINIVIVGGSIEIVVAIAIDIVIDIVIVIVIVGGTMELLIAVYWYCRGFNGTDFGSFFLPFMMSALARLAIEENRRAR